MSPGTHMLCSFALTYGIPALLAWRELRTLPKRGGGGRDPEPAPEIWPRDGGRPLPECLIPRLPPAPVAPSRVLEDA